MSKRQTKRKEWSIGEAVWEIQQAMRVAFNGHQFFDSRSKKWKRVEFKNGKWSAKVTK
jgi:hypothetical protein